MMTIIFKKIWYKELYDNSWLNNVCGRFKTID